MPIPLARSSRRLTRAFFAGDVLEVGVAAREAAERLFDAFYTTKKEGTGLGLAIVKHVVTAAGGEVEATGGPGHGLTVRCSFSMSAPS